MTNGDKDIAIFKFNSAGDTIWGKYWGTSIEEESSGITIDNTKGFIYVTGSSVTVTL